jgi:glycosyltransferase involved in cell wall biosynthesis
MPPLISIIVPCYNQAIYLTECLNSVLAQTYDHWECLIVDDGSPDNTAEVAIKFEKQDTRFIYLKKENGGLPSARNYGIRHARGAFILPLDADDKIHPEYLAAALRVFQSNDQIAVVYCKARLFGAVNRRWYLPAFSPERLAKDNIVFCSALIRKNTLDKVGGYDEKLIYGKEDWDLWIGIYSAGGQFYRINKVLFFYRIKQQSMITDFRKNYEKNFYTHSLILSKHHVFFTDAMIKRMYEPLYMRALDDLRQLLMHIFYRICRFF